jgi:AcrR family transcriptional regulator
LPLGLSSDITDAMSSERAVSTIDDGADTGRKPRKSAVTVVPPLPKTDKGRRRRQTIIDAAAVIVDEVGYANLSVALIAEKAEAPIGLYYRYFRNKADPVLAALEESLDDYSDQLTGAEQETDFFRSQVQGFNLFERLFRAHPGLLSCYYSYDYGEPAFSSFFHDRTLAFDRMHLERTMRLLDTPAPADILLPVAHFLVAMVDNVVFRLCTGRDEIQGLAVAGDIKLEELVAALRHRLYALTNPVQARAGLASLSGKRRKKALRPLPAIDLEVLFKRQPKRADSTGTLDTVLGVTLSLLNRHPLDDMRIKDVEEQAGITRGVIYHYFNEKRDLAWAAVSGRLAALHSALLDLKPAEDCGADDVIRAIVSILVREYAANPGVLRAVYQFESSHEEGGRLLQFRAAIARLIGELLYEILPEQDRTPILAAMLAYVLIATIDRFCYDTFVVPFAEIGEHLSNPDEAMEFLVSLSIRMLLARNPASYDGKHPGILWLLDHEVGGKVVRELAAL